MKGVTMRSTIAIALSAAAQFSSAARAQPIPRDQDAAEKREAVEAKVEGAQRFDGALGLAAERTGRVAVHTWILHNKEKIERLPVSGLLLVELRAGQRCTTIIDGKRVERKEGDFWLVPAGSAMGVETGRFSVVLQTIALTAMPVIR